MKKLLDFLSDLESREIYYRLNKVSENLLVEIAVPGERWEVEFLPDGSIQAEKFVTTGCLRDESALQELFSRH